jgi:acyl-CoA reductase-like NAD-dependent aldehyde dehydrogenase
MALPYKSVRLFCGNAQRQIESSRRILMPMIVRSPWDGHEVGAAEEIDAREMERAIAAAVAAAPIVAAMPRYERQAVLRRIATGLERERERFIELMIAESSKPRRYARAEVDRAISTFSLAADEVTRPIGDVLPLDVTAAGVGYTAMAVRRPIGAIGGIAPFNFPLNLVAHKIAPAIAVGNPMVLKAPPQAPLTAFALARLVQEAGWPAHAFRVVHAPVDVAQALATDERLAMLSFTGSAAVGWHLKSIAGRKRVALELGGNAAAVVCADADLAWAAQRIALGAFAQAGQVCIKVQRILVQRERYEAFLPLLLAEIAKLAVGDPSDEATIVGPVIDDRSAERIASWVDEAIAGGAVQLYGKPRNGKLIYPTLLTNVNAAMKVECEEIFGPVATIAAVDSLDDAITRVNDTRYGLQAGVFTTDVRTIGACFERIEVGGLIVNDFPTLRIDNFPYGGIKESGFGREGVRYAMDEMSELKTLVVKYR